MNWKHSKRSMELRPSEYLQWVDELRNAESCINYYHNWSCPPWIVERWGVDTVLAELEERLGKPLSIKEVTYDRVKNCAAHTYYIVEVRK